MCHGQGCRVLLGMGDLPPIIGNPYNWYIKAYYWVDDHPLLYGNNGSCTCEVQQFPSNFRETIPAFQPPAGGDSLVVFVTPVDGISTILFPLQLEDLRPDQKSHRFFSHDVRFSRRKTNGPKTIKRTYVPSGKLT